MFTEVLLAALLLLLLLVFGNRKPQGLPPGPWGWPVLGKLPSKDLPLAEHVKALRRTHGDIISWRMGGRIYIFLCNYKVIRAAFTKPEFSSRPDLFSQKVFTDFTNSGITFNEGLGWQTHRRFVLRQLKDLGMGKSSLEAAILHEARCLVKDLGEHLGRPEPLPWSIHVAVLNVIWKLTADRRYDVADQEIQNFNKLISRSLEIFSGLAEVYDMFPWLRSVVPRWLEARTEIGEYLKIADNIAEFMAGVIREHQESLDPHNPRDYIDSYLLEMEAQQKEDPNCTLNLLDLRCGVAALFIAGTHTVSVTLKAILLYLVKYPEIQKKVQKEIDDVVGKDALPTTQDKESLPYLEATILECLRVTSLAPLGLTHSAARDTPFEGYVIPKDALIMSHIDCCHTDPGYWDRPLEFRPEHFLDDQGKVVSKKDGFLPFSVGRRVCLGEQLANVELFIFTAALLKNFSFSAPEGVEASPKNLFVEQKFVIERRTGP